MIVKTIKEGQTRRKKINFLELFVLSAFSKVLILLRDFYKEILVCINAAGDYLKLALLGLIKPYG